MTRAVYEKVSGLDERFGLGLFDDHDLAERSRRAGFELAVAHDLFVHHFGSRSFAGNGVNAGKLLDENARRFAEKWGLAKPNFSTRIPRSRIQTPDSKFLSPDNGKRTGMAIRRFFRNRPRNGLGRQYCP